MEQSFELNDRQRAVLRLLVARAEEYSNVDLSYCRLDWLEESGLDHDEVIGVCEELIELGLAETGGLLVRALLPSAREALSFRGDRLRLSALV